MSNKLIQKRIITLICSIYFLAVSIISWTFILTHEEHEHTNTIANESCTICLKIQIAENILNYLSTAFVGVIHFTIGLIALIIIIKIINIHIFHTTLITLKVRMNN